MLQRAFAGDKSNRHEIDQPPMKIYPYQCVCVCVCECVYKYKHICICVYIYTHTYTGGDMN